MKKIWLLPLSSLYHSLDPTFHIRSNECLGISSGKPTRLRAVAFYLILSSLAGMAAAQESPPVQTPNTEVQDLRGKTAMGQGSQATPTPVDVRSLLAENQALRLQMSDLIQSGAETDTLRKQNETLKQEITKLAAKVLELDQVKAREMSAKKKLSTLSELKKRLQESEDENRSLKVQLAGMVQTASQLEAASREIAQLKAKEKSLSEERSSLLPLREENQALKQKVLMLESQIAGLIETESETARLREEVTALRTEKSELLKEPQAQSQFLKQQVEALKLKNQAFKEAERNRQDLLTQVRELQERTQLLERNNEEIKKLRQELDRLRSAETTPPKSAVITSPPSSLPVETKKPEVIGGGVIPASETPTSSTQESTGTIGDSTKTFTRYESDSTREVLEQRIREEIERRKSGTKPSEPQ